MKKGRPSREVRLLLEILDESYERSSWHGPNLRGSLRGLTAKEAAWRPLPGKHTIWELVLHAAYWKYVVRRRLLREKRGAFPVQGSNWFKRPDSAASESAWRKDIRLLDASHRMMRKAVEDLGDIHRKANKSWSVSETVYGIAFHDVYHAGQIQLLKRLIRSRVRGRR